MLRRPQINWHRGKKKSSMASRSKSSAWIAEAKQRSQGLVNGWVTKIYYLELLLHASGGTLSCWSPLHLQSLVPTVFPRRVNVRQTAGRKNNYHNMVKNMYRPYLVG
jgi:hypothetical protein